MHARACISRWLAAASLLGLPLWAWAQNVVTAIGGTQAGAGEVLRIELQEPLPALPASFTIQTPPRIAIDLPGVGNALGRNVQELNVGNVRSVAVAQAGERTRLVVNLKQATSYSASLEGKVLLLRLDPVPVPAPVSAAAAAAAPAPAAVPPASARSGGTTEAVRFAEPQNDATQALRDIDFRRGRDGAGRVVVELPSPQVGVDIRQQGQKLVVEFLRTSLPERLRRRLDVTDFGTPVQSVSTVQAGDRVRMVVEPSGSWEHSAYQTDNQFVLEVRSMKVDPDKLTQGPGYTGEKLSLNFQSIEVRSLLQVIADFTNFNVVTSDTVTGNVTLRLKDVPWDQALDIIMQAKGLGVKKNGNVLWIAPKEELAAKEKAELEAKKQVNELEPLRTQSFQLNYTKSQDVARALTGQSLAGAGGVGGGTSAGVGNAGRILSARGSVIAEQRTNQLFVSDIPSKLEEVSQLIAKIDIPVRQVMIEARIVEAEDSWGRSLGVKLGTSDVRAAQGGTPGYGVGGSTRVAIGGTYTGVGASTSQTTSSSFTDTQFVNLPANALSASSAATFALSLFSASANRFLNLELSAMESENKGKIVSSPRIVTADQTKAIIKQGRKIAYQQATSSGATAVTFVEAVLSLEVTPQITPEGGIILDVDVHKDSPVDGSVISVDTKQVKTQVLVDNGGTVVIGGIFQMTESNLTNKVPLLGDVPGLGVLFRQNTKQLNKTELMVFLTPKVITERGTAQR
jgi:type IV pilus assembly protein PilQ